MKVIEYGKENKAVIMLLHGGGLAPWNYREEAQLLKDQFHVVTPILDGHNGSDRNFVSIEENAGVLIRYIDEAFGGRVLLIGGLSLGGQILLEMLSQRERVCAYAVLESASVLPMKAGAALIGPSVSLCYPLIKQRWFAKLQFRSLHIKPTLFDDYYRDSAAIRKEDMIAFLKANSSYRMKDTLSECCAVTLVLAGGRERRIIKTSAEIIRSKMRVSTLEILRGYRHGDFSVNHAEAYTERLLRLIGNERG